MADATNNDTLTAVSPIPSNPPTTKLTKNNIMLIKTNANGKIIRFPSGIYHNFLLPITIVSTIVNVSKTISVKNASMTFFDFDQLILAS